jgi:hypothetical protein
VLEPESTLIKVADFLSVEYDGEMLNYYLTTENEGLEPKEFLEWKEKNSRPILPEEAFKHEQLASAEKLMFEKACQTELAIYGYNTT